MVTAFPDIFSRFLTWMNYLPFRTTESPYGTLQQLAMDVLTYIYVNTLGCYDGPSALLASVMAMRC